MERRNKKYILFILFLTLTLVVVVTGILFTSRNFRAYCYNYDDASLNAEIEKTVKGECNNKSIFLLKESELEKKLESKFPTIDVVKIERIFPDTVKINYAIKKSYVYTIVDGIYKYLSKDCKVLASDGGEISNANKLIKLVTAEEAKDGEYLFSSNGYTYGYVFSLLDTMEKMGFKRAETMIEEIDLSRVEKDLIVLKWRSGASIHIEYPSINFVKKVQLAVSAITTCEDSKRTSGVWRVYSDKVSYAQN